MNLSHFNDYSENDDICLKRHRKRYNLTDPIIAYYRTWNDFVEDWCDNTGFTNSEARKMLHGGKGEFKQLPNGHGIVRFLVLIAIRIEKLSEMTVFFIEKIKNLS